MLLVAQLEPVGVVGVAARSAAPSLVPGPAEGGDGSKNNFTKRRTPWGRGAYKPCRKRPGSRIRLQCISKPELKPVLMRCKCWVCTECGPWMKDRFIKVASAEAKRQFGNQCRFLTLTLPPEARDLPVRQRFQLMSAAWKRFCKRVYDRPTHKNKKTGKPVRKKLSAIWVRETHQDGTPHLHVLIDRFLPVEWVRHNWVACGGGERVDIRQVKMQRVASYVAKYLSKALGQTHKDPHGKEEDGLKGVRRYGTTGDCRLEGVYPKKNGTEKWGIWWKPGVTQRLDWRRAESDEVGLAMMWVETWYGPNGMAFRKGLKLDHMLAHSLRERADRMRASQAAATHLHDHEMSDDSIAELANFWAQRRAADFGGH